MNVIRHDHNRVQIDRDLILMPAAVEHDRSTRFRLDPSVVSAKS
jgi:hypothetical protein